MASPTISPAEVAIKALHLSKTYAVGSVLDKQLTLFLQEKGIPNDNITGLLQAADPIFKELCTSLKSPMPPTPPQDTTPKVHHRPRFPDPEPFDGTRTSYPVFKQKARAKIDIDGAIYDSELGQVNYLFNRLSGTAAKVVLPWLNAHHSPTLASFWTFMDSRFSDPQAKARALDKLQSMRQKPTEDIRDYLTRFDQELLESEVQMDNAIKISTFTRGLKPQVQRDIAIVNQSLSFEEYCHEAIRIQDVHKRISFFARSSSLLQQGAPASPQLKQSSDAMDWEPTRVNTVQTTHTGKGRAKWVSQDEITRRKNNRLCIRCGTTAHMIKNCPYAPARRPQSMEQVSIATTAFEEPQLEQEDQVSEN